MKMGIIGLLIIFLSIDSQAHDPTSKTTPNFIDTLGIRKITKEEIKNLPVRSLSGYLLTQPGVVFQDHLLHIRGGRSDEIGYFVDGVSTKNILNGENSIQVIPEALERIEFQAMPFNPHSGGVNAGLVNQVLKEGGSVYHGSLKMETDNFTRPNQPRFGTYSYGYADYVLTLSGPVPGWDRAKFFIAGENQFQRDRSVKYFPGAFFGKVGDSGYRGGNSADTVNFIVKNGNIKSNASNRYTGNGSLQFDLKSILLKISGSFTRRRFQSNATPIKNAFNQDRLPETDESDGLLSFKITHFLRPKIFYHVKFNLSDLRSKITDPVYGDHWLSYNDSLENSKNGWRFRTYTNAPNQYDFYGFAVNRPGTPLTIGEYSSQKYFGGSINFSYQTGNHELQVGGEMKYHTLRHLTGYGSGSILTLLRNNPDYSRLKPGETAPDGVTYEDWITIFRLYRRVKDFGFDIFGNEVDSGPFRPRKPRFGGVYVIEKYTSTFFDFQAGFRIDYINMDYKSGGVLSTSSMLIGGGPYRDSKKTILSPHFEIALPSSSQTTLHFQYGKFAQGHSLNDVYLTSIYDFEPVVTTHYQAGLNHQFLDNFTAEVRGFQKEEEGQLILSPVLDNGVLIGYTGFSYGGASIKGLQFSLIMNRIERLEARVNYSYNKMDYRPPFNLTHSGNVLLNYRFGKEDGLIFFEQSSMNLIFTFQSGRPRILNQTSGSFQPGAWPEGVWSSGDGRNRIAPETKYSESPWVFNLDIRIDKTVNIANLNLNFYIYAMNALDLKQVVNVYDRTGNADSDGWLDDPLSDQTAQNFADANGISRYKEFYHAFNDLNREHLTLNSIPDVYGHPRQLRFGISIEY